MTARAIASFCASLSIAALIAAPAQATQIHPFLSSFSPPAGFEAPLGVAINQTTEEVYIADYGSGAVYAFSPSGILDPTHPRLTEANGSTPYPFNHPYYVAVDNSGDVSNGDIYVSEPEAGKVLRFDPAGAFIASINVEAVPAQGTPQSGALPAVLNNGSFGTQGLAVAPDGDLYVADNSNNVVDVFEPNGTFASQFGAGFISGPNGIAVDASGNLYVANGSGTLEFDSAGACINSCTPIDPVGSLGVAIDSAGNVYADEGNQITEYDHTLSPTFSFGAAPEGVFGGLSFSYDVAVNSTTGKVYVTDINNRVVDIFGPVTTVPNLTAASPVDLAAGSATLVDRVAPDSAHGGGPVTTCRFEWGIDSSYGHSVPCLGAAETEVGTPFTPISSETEVHADITGLTGLTTYHFRLVAGDVEGVAIGADQTFRTLSPHLPTIDTTTASNLTTDAATLEAQVDPGSGATVTRFQYGTTSSYGSSTPISESIGSDATDHPAIATVTGLTPATTYHYRAVAINLSGTTRGPDESFTTPGAPAVAGATVSAVASTSATLSAQINPHLGSTSYRFAYGPTAANSLSTPQSPSIGADESVHYVSADLVGLLPETIYHFQVIATNPFGVADGPDETFTTTSVVPMSSTQTNICKKGSVRRHGKCAKAAHHKTDHRHHHA